MSNRQRTSSKKIQYPFIVRPVLEGWEVLFTAIDRPYREAFFETQESAQAFAETKNQHWVIARENYYQLISRISDRIERDFKQPRRRNSKTIAGWLERMLGRRTRS